MDINWNVVATIAAPVLALLVGMVVERYFELRPRLISYCSHVSDFIVRTDNEFKVYTHSIVIKNAGRRPAHNIRVGHFVEPKNYEIYPAIEHSLVQVQDTGPEIKISILVPEEQITISYLYLSPYTVNQYNSYIKSDEGFAKRITVLSMKQYPMWLNRTVAGFSITGFIVFIYLIYEAINYFI